MAENSPAAGGLSANQERALVGLLAAPNLESAAERCGLSVRTLWRYLQDAHFEAAYRRARRQQLAAATARLQRAAESAVAALEDIATSEKASASARVSACRVILDVGYRALEDEDLQARIQALGEAGREF